jgi:sirohydrochlorin cobaltochelatase
MTKAESGVFCSAGRFDNAESENGGLSKRDGYYDVLRTLNIGRLGVFLHTCPQSTHSRPVLMSRDAIQPFWWESAATGRRGLLVVGHGTADPVGVDETRRVAKQVAALLPGVPVEFGFLEVCDPGIGEAVGRLAAAGCHEVVAAPLLLFEAGHAKRDVPAAMLEAAVAHAMRVHQAEPLGCHPDIVLLSRRRRAEALAGLDDLPSHQMSLVMIARGSSDPDASRQIETFADATLSGYDLPRPHRLHIGFVAAARPTVDEALHAAADPSDGAVRRIIVQPHLLFRGHVEEQVIAVVEAGRVRRPDIEWVRVARLGADPLVARALIDRAAAALAGGAAVKTPRQTGEESSQ